MPNDEKVARVATGFARYELSLDPGEVREFQVEEEAQYIETVADSSSMKTFIDERASTLLESGALAQNIYQALSEYQQYSSTRNMLFEIQSRSKSLPVSNLYPPLGSKQEIASWADLRGITELAHLFQLIDAENDKLDERNEQSRNLAIIKARVTTTFENQQRLRENIKSMEKVSSEKLVNRYLVDLNNEEDALIEARKTIATLDQALVDIERERGRLRLQISQQIEQVNESIVNKLRSMSATFVDA